MKSNYFAYFFFLASGLSVSAATHYVNNGSVAGNCPGQYPSIQAGINASAPGDTVVVCNGIYNEQPVVSQPLTLNGQDGATVQPVNAVPNAEGEFNIIEVDNSSNVTISGLIIDGSLANVSSNLSCYGYSGIYFFNSSRTITHNTVRYIQEAGRCTNGNPIFAFDQSGASYTVTVQGNSLHDFEQYGITAYGAGLEASIIGNYITGNVLSGTPTAKQTGIQLGPYATGTISNNYISNLIYPYPDCTGESCSYASTGILIYDSVGDSVTSNSIDVTQGGIVSLSDTNPAALNTTISSNRISNTQAWNGIILQSGGCTVSNNTIVGSSQSAVYVSGDNSDIHNNTVIESPIGILIGSGTNTQISAEANYGVALNQLIVTSAPNADAETVRRHPYKHQ